MFTVAAPEAVVRPCVVLKTYEPVEFEVRLTARPTVVGVPLADSSVIVIGPSAAPADSAA